MLYDDFSPVFIGACPRSGTTFLGDRLGKLTSGKVTPESQFKRRVLEALASQNTDRAVRELENHYVYRLWRDRPTASALLESKTAIDFFAKLVFPNGIKPNQRPIWIDHTPINFDDFETLRAVFPRARFINLVRDGRAVFSSVRDLEWGPTNPIQGANWWAMRTAAGLGASISFPDICKTVRYEDLVRGDPAVWSELIRFATCGESFVVSPEDLQADGEFEVPEFTRHQHTLVGTAPRKERADAWRKRLSARDIELFEAYAGSLLDCLGYRKDYSFPRYASRFEMIRMGEWPIRITAQIMTRINLARRWSKVKEPEALSKKQDSTT